MKDSNKVLKAMVQMLNTANNNGEAGKLNAEQCEILAEVIERGLELNYTFNEYTQFGYNSNSGYVWLWSEDEQYSLGLADYGFYRGDDVDIIFTCPFDGEEFIGFDPDEVVNEYFEHVRERLQEDEITQDDIVETIYINGVRYEFEA